MTYVDGFVLPVPSANRKAYEDVARKSAAVFLKHGALRVVECWPDDVPEGEVTSFPMAVKLEEAELAVFSWIEWPDRETRDAGNKAAMEDPAMGGFDPATMPFNAKRMIWGGFASFLDQRP